MAFAVVCKCQILLFFAFKWQGCRLVGSGKTEGDIKAREKKLIMWSTEGIVARLLLLK